MSDANSPRTRDPEGTRARILAAATAEFANAGLGGARVDEIAAKAGANKRMIYHYFGSKEALFKAVIEAAYTDFRQAEAALQIDHLPPEAAMETLVRFTWGYYLAHPEFITLVNSENLHDARHIKDSATLRTLSKDFVARMEGLLQRGIDAGVFRAGLDPVQVNITIAAIGYYYLTNRHTGAIVFERDLMTAAALEARLDFNIETILRLVRKD